MPEDIKIRIRPEGIKAAVKDLNDAADAADRVARAGQIRTQAGSELASLARQQRAAAFAQLPAEQQVTALLQRQARIKRFMARADLDETRAMQLKLSLRRNELALKQASGGTGLLGRGRELVSEIPGGASALRMLALIGPQSLAAAAAMASFAGSVRSAQRLSDLAVTVQLSTARLQGLQYAAAATGTSFESLTRGIVNVRKTSADALRGEQLMQQAFADLGVTMAQLRTMSSEEIFFQISAGLSDGNVSAKEFNALLRVMEEEGRTLLPSFSKGLADIAREFDDLGQTASTTWTAAFTDLGDTWDRWIAKGTASFSRFKDFVSGGIFELGADMAKGIAILTGDFATLEQLQTEELLRKDPDTAGAQARIQELQRQLERNRAARNEAPGGDDDAALKREVAITKEIDAIRFRALTYDEKREELARKIRETEQNLSARITVQGGIVTEQDKADELKALQLREQLAGLQNPASLSMTTESLAQAGRSRGGSDTARIMDVAMRATGALEELRGIFQHPLLVELDDK